MSKRAKKCDEKSHKINKKYWKTNKKIVNSKNENTIKKVAGIDDKELQEIKNSI